MRNTILAYIDRFRHDRRERAMLGSVLAVLAVVVTLLVYWQLRLNGIAMTNETYCGYEEHVHTEECYEYTLVCGLEETGHVHDESCYEEQQVLVCTIEESEGHSHGETCYDEEGNLICGLSESEGHTHDESCYETQLVLVCGLEETSDAHVHTDECYEYTLVCELEEHTHTAECLVDLTADIEDATIWEATLPELTGDLRTDIVAVANSQVGYTESTANYTLGEDGITHYGYTRYGAWYGVEYADWDSMFTAFCLDYAGVADEFTYNAGAYAWSVDLAAAGYYQSADGYTPSAGDIVFIDTDLDGKADRTAIVVSYDATFTYLTVVEGNSSVTDSEGNVTDQVAFATYDMTATAEAQLQAGLATISSEGDAGEEAEIIPVILGYADVTYTTEAEASEEEVSDEEEVDLDEEEAADETAEAEVIGSSAVLTYYGDDYVVTVSYDESALLPEGTYLIAYEYSSDSETYLQRYAESAAIYGWEGEPTEDFRVFNIGLYYDGIEIEPAAEIQVSITYTDIDNASSASVTHHDETAEPLYAVSEYSEETGTETVTFTTDGFSDYSIMLTSESNSTITDNLAEAADVVWSYTSASYEDGSFDVKFHIDFTNLPISTITAENYTFYLSLPDGVTVPDSLVGTTFTGYDNSGNAAFTYYFEETADGWQITVVFDQSYVTAATTNLVDGYINFSGSYTLQDKNEDDTSDVTIYSGDEVVIIINGEDIDTEDNENWLADITVQKSGTGYSTSTNSITYTILISSENGTQNEINLSDAISFVNNSIYSGTDLSVESITIDSVTYYANYFSGSYYSDGTAVTDYTYTITDDGLTITLDALKGTSGSTEQWTTTSGDCYVIVYTVTFDTPSSGEYSSSITNGATVTTDTDAGEIEDDAEITYNAISSSLSKTGSYNSDEGTISWVITFNSSGGNIAGYTVYDYENDNNSFAEAVNGIGVYPGTYGTDYEYVYDDTTEDIIGIKFLAVTDTDGDGVADSNTNSYIITYTTEASTYLGSSGYTARNIVTVEDESDNEQGTQYGDVYVGTGGSLHKELTSSDADTITDSNGTTTRALTWTTTVSITGDGIKSGTVLVDYLGTSGKDYSSYTSTSSTDQWFTYSQIYELLSGLATNGITVGDDTISYNSGANFTLEAYDATAGVWVNYSALVSSAYENDLFTAYRITFNADFEYTGTWTITYSTTADISDVEDNTVTSQTYYNSVNIGTLEAYASYTEHNKVYKTDGNGQSGTSSVIINDSGTLTWIVHLYIQPGSTETYTITDTLPSGVTFDSAKVTINWDSATLTDDDNDGQMTANFGWITSTAITGDVTENADGTTTVNVYVDPAHYTQLASAGGEITITYTVHITDFDSTTYTEEGTYDLGTYTNNVKVYYGTSTETYGEDEQTQDAGYTVTEEGGETDEGHDAVEKSGDYYNGDNTLRYSVLVNLDAEELNGGNSLKLTDVAEVYYSGSGEGYNNALISLINSSVTIYHLNLITYDESNDSGTYVDLSGTTHTVTGVSTDSNVYAYEESDGSYTYYYKIADPTVTWTYSTTDNGYGTYYYTLTITIPDSTAVLIEYQYSVTGIEGGGFGVNNTATLTGESATTEKDQNSESGTWSESQTSAGITSGSGIVIYKVEADNYGTTVPGALFELYKYDTSAGAWVQVTYSDFQYGYNVSSGETVDNSGDDTMNESNYLVTDSSGVIMLSNEFSYTVDKDQLYAYYSWYDPNTLYYIVEVAAPSGYELITNEKVYFYWADEDSTITLVYPSDVDQWSTKIYNLNATPISPSVYIENQPNTSFTLVKVSTNDQGQVLAGATFALYEYHDDADVTAADGKWVQIGTYVTDSNGEIVITFNDQIYTFNHAYKLVEISAPDGYNIAYGDDVEFYFYWSSDDYTLYPPVLPSDWASGSTGTSPSEALDIATVSGSVTATNTKTATTVSALKTWLSETGEDISDSSYTATVQLYSYVSTCPTSTGTSTSEGTSSLGLITLASSSADTTATLFTRSLSRALSDSSWTSNFMGGDISSFISALYNSDYSDGYVEIIISGGGNPSSLSLIFQSNDGNYSTLASVSPTGVTTTVDPDNASNYYYTVQYSISSIMSALSGCSEDDIGFICVGSLSDPGTMTSISVKGNANYAVTTSTLGSTLSSSSSWISTYYGNNSVRTALAEDGAIIAVTYSNATSGSVLVGVQFDEDGDGSGDTSYSTAVNVSGTSGTVYVLVSDLEIPDTIDWSTYLQVYVQYNSWAGEGNDVFTGTIDSISILIPADTIASTTYSIVATATETPSYSSGTNELTNLWSTYLTQDPEVISALTTDGAMIYIEYTCTDVPGSATLGLQYTTNTYGDSESISITTHYATGSNYIAIPVSSVFSGTYDASTYNAIFLSVGQNDSGKVTITSVSVLVPYVAEAGVSPSVSTKVTLYDPDVSSLSTTSIVNSWYTWNYISSLEDETQRNDGDYSYATTFTGYGFLDAVYSDSAEYVEVTLSNVSDATLLSKLYLVIQGDLSVDYVAICNVAPTEVVDNEDGTYTLRYSTETIIEYLSTNTGNYASASDAYADYNAIILSFAGTEAFSATLTDLDVVGTVTAYYSESSLVGSYSADGTAYTDTETGGVYTLNSSNNWSVAVKGLPLSYTYDGTTYYYHYYFVETSSSGVDTSLYTVSTTYSQAEGENGGGEIVIVNTLIEKTSVSVKKVWMDGTTDVSDDSGMIAGTIEVDLYYYLDSATGSQNAIGTYSRDELVGENTSSYYYGTYTVDYGDNKDWTLTVSGLPKYTVVGTEVYTRYYYFVETGTTVTDIDVADAEYSQAEGTTGGGLITITNNVGEDSYGYVLPSTGSQTGRMYVFAGLMLMLIALVACAYRNIRLIGFEEAGGDEIIRKPSKRSTPGEPKLFGYRKKPGKDRNGDSRAGPKS